MTRKDKLLKAFSERLETLETEILDYPSWADQKAFDESIREATQTAEMIRIITED